MGYIENNLTKEEKIHHRGEIHTIVVILMAIFSLGFIYYLYNNASDDFEPQYLLLFIVAFIYGYLEEVKSFELAITNKRLIYKKGLLVKKSIELNLNQIESANVDSNVIGQILGFGKVVVVGSGGSKQELHYAIKNPEDFVKKLQEKYSQPSEVIVKEKDEVSTNDMDTKKSSVNKASSTDSSADELKKFSDLKEQGILTEEEFEAKKKELLGL